MWILMAGRGGGLHPCPAVGDGAMGPLGGSSLDSEVTCPHKSHCFLGTNGCDSCMLLRLLTVKTRHRSCGPCRTHTGLPGHLMSAPLISWMVPPQRQLHPELDPADADGSATVPSSRVRTSICITSSAPAAFTHQTRGRGLSGREVPTLLFCPELLSVSRTLWLSSVGFPAHLMVSSVSLVQPALTFV